MKENRTGAFDSRRFCFIFRLQLQSIKMIKLLMMLSHRNDHRRI